MYMQQLLSNNLTALAQVATSCVTTKVGNPNGPAPTLPPECSSQSPNQSQGQSTGGSGSCSITPGKVPLCKQWDPKWASHPYCNGNTMQSGACGPTSLAMVMSFYLNKIILPPDVADYISANHWSICGGTDDQEMTLGPQHWGLKGKAVTWEQAKTYLKQGIPVIQVHGAGYFTGGGHFIVLTGVNSDGTYSVNDPDGKHRTSATEAQITASLENSWVISK